MDAIDATGALVNRPIDVRGSLLTMGTLLGRLRRAGGARGYEGARGGWREQSGGYAALATHFQTANFASSVRSQVSLSAWSLMPAVRARTGTYL